MEAMTGCLDGGIGPSFTIRCDRLQVGKIRACASTGGCTGAAQGVGSMQSISGRLGGATPTARSGEPVSAASVPSGGCATAVALTGSGRGDIAADGGRGCSRRRAQIW